MERVRLKESGLRALPKPDNPKGKFYYNKKGRPSFEPTDEQIAWVENAAAEGLTKDRICRLILNPTTGQPIDEKTFDKHFRDHYEFALDKAKLELGRTLFNQAQGEKEIRDPRGNVIRPYRAPNMTALIWWEKTRAGRKEVQQLQHAGPNGEPLPVSPPVIYLPSNGRETGAGGDPEFVHKTGETPKKKLKRKKGK